MLDDTLCGTKMIVVSTFDYNNHIFKLVSEQNKPYLKFEDNPNYIKKLIIKPDFWILFQNGGYEQCVNMIKPLNSKLNKILAMDFSIDPEIFEILIKNGLISYSKAMADLYGFDIKFSRDYLYHIRDYKRSKNKVEVIKKLKKGNFN